jgi:hypothetical protein
MDVVHIKWLACPSGDYNRAKGKEGYPTFLFNVLVTSTAGCLAFMVHSLERETIRKL